MSDFDSDSVAMHPGSVDLADGARSHWLVVELLKHLVDLLVVEPLDDLLGLGVLMGGGMFPQDLELDSYLLPNDVSPVTQILEGLDPNHPRLLDSPEKDPNPPIPGRAEQIQRQTYY